VIFLSATLVAIHVFSLASALCLRFARVAAVRGGTYFSLLPQGDFLRGARQRKVAKSKMESKSDQTPLWVKIWWIASGVQKTTDPKTQKIRIPRVCPVPGGSSRVALCTPGAPTETGFRWRAESLCANCELGIRCSNHADQPERY